MKTSTPPPVPVTATAVVPPAARRAATHALTVLVELQGLLTAQDAGQAPQAYPDPLMGHSVLREK